MVDRGRTSNSSRIIAIGDIHGCAKAFEALIQAIQPTHQDLIIAVGDYVDRGPDSRGVIDQMIALSERCNLVPLLGNHEVMMLSGLQEIELGFWIRCGGDTTLESYGGSIDSVPDEHVDFVRRCRRYYETDEHIFVHANYQHDLPLDQQPDELLFWTHISYHIPQPHFSGKTAIVGHTPQADGEILYMDHLIGIDTYCFGNGWLTALNVETGETWQTDKEGKLRERRDQ